MSWSLDTIKNYLLQNIGCTEKNVPSMGKLVLEGYWGKFLIHSNHAGDSLRLSIPGYGCVKTLTLPCSESDLKTFIN
jgi:hypothetical protein